MKKIRVGMIGAGQIAYGHCRGIQAHPQAELVAVADPFAANAKRLAKEFNIPQVFGKHTDLLANAGVDAVSIAVPNSLHAPIALDALNAGNHVMLDKPFALNLREAKRVVALAKKKRRVFTLGMNQRFAEGSQIIKALAVKGTLGEIYHGKAFWVRRSGCPKSGTWFCNKKYAGGGCMLDIGVHMLDLCLYLMDNFKPVAVSGAAYTKFGNRGLGEGSWGMSKRGKHPFTVDDFATALIKLKGGATVSLDVAWACHQEEPNRNNVQLFGTEAGAQVYPAKVFQYGKKKGAYDVSEPKRVKGPYAGKDRFANWIDAILRKDKLCVTVEQALAVQSILDAVYKSSKTGKEVRIK